MTSECEAVPDLSPLVRLGDGCAIDAGVLLGYRTGRRIENEELIIGDHARVRSGSVVYAGSRIGSRFETGHNVVVREENEIGNGVCIWSNTVLGYGCRLGDGVKLHCNITVGEFTVIEDEAFVSANSVLANDVHPGCAFSSQCMRGPHICRGAQIGVNVTILPFVTIGERALVGAGSVVTRDIPAGAVAVGTPARVVKSIADLKCVTGLTERPYPE